MHFSLILPCFNEQDNISATVQDCLDWFRSSGIDGELIAVNDGSTDGTGEKLAALEREHDILTVLTHTENRGYGAALLTGLDAATKEWMGYMDSDGQFKAHDFDKLLPYTDDVSFVTGRRFQRADPLFRKINAKLFAALNVLVLFIWVHDINCAMKMWRRDLWPQIRPRVSTGALFNAEMFYRIRKHHIPWLQVFVNHYPRRAGEQTGAKLSVILRMFKEMVKLKIAGRSFGE